MESSNEFQTQPLLPSPKRSNGTRRKSKLAAEVWSESKKLWHIVGPTIISRLSNTTMGSVTQLFAGHLGDVEFASISISTQVIVGFSWGLLV